ncbi:MAG: tetratricopeptide repeat protein [Bacillota bacterium]
MKIPGKAILIRLNRKLRNKYYCWGIVAIAAGIAYCNSFVVPFHLDDFGSISNNYAIHRLFNFPELWKFYANRIILYITLSINYAIHGTAVEGYHAVNLFIHIVNGCLFYTILKKLLSLQYFKGKDLSRYRYAVSLAAAMLFVSHPIQVNAVTYIVQRTASLAACFYMSAILFYINYRIFDKWHYLLSTVLFTIMAMFTKENTATIPFMLLFTELMFFLGYKKTSRIKMAGVFIFLFATIPIIPATNIFFKGYNMSDPNQAFKASTSMDRFQYFYTQLNVILHYIRLLFIPIGQNFDYSDDYPLSVAIWENYSYVSLAVLLVIVFFGIYALKRNRLVSYGIAWFFIALAVESSFISIKDVYFEHRVYLPCAGFIIFLAGMSAWVKKDPGAFMTVENRLVHVQKGASLRMANPAVIFVALSAVLFPVYAGLTVYRNYIYSDTIRLWSDVTAKAPASDRAHSSLATGYLNAYDEKEKNTEYLDLAEIEFKKAISLNNGNSTAHTNLSKVYLLKGDYQKCIKEAKRALQISNSEYAQFNMGSALKNLGRTDEALKAFLKGYSYNKHSSFILKALGDIYYETGDYANAAKYYKEYLEHVKVSPNSEIRKRLDEIKERPGG